jgi:hypothetical protein
MKMHISRLVAAQFIVMLTLAVSVYGQGCGGNWMSPGYSTYATLTSDSTKLYSTVEVSGSTSGQCPISCNCTGTMHTPHAYNKIGSTGGWGAGTPVPWNGWIEYENTKSVTATSTLVAVQTQGEVICSYLGVFYLSAIVDSYTGKSPNCGNNQDIVIVVPPQSQTCDGTTTYQAVSTVTGPGEPYIVDIDVSTTTDNSLLLDLIDGPNKGDFCTSGTWCYSQSYKAAVPNQYTGTTGNINWNYNIFCGTRQDPDIYGVAKQNFTCK